MLKSLVYSLVKRIGAFTAGNVAVFDANGNLVDGGSPAGTGINQLTGDVTAGPGSGSQAATIANDAVTNAKLANVATQTLKGRTTAGTGDPEDLTATQATAVLNAMVGDSGAGGTKGLVPAPAAGDSAAGKFLKADGTYAVPAGTGGSGNVTAGGTLTSGQPVLGAGTTAVAVGAINLAGGASFVSGDLPFANLAQIAGLSVAGVTGSSTADLAAITAATDGHVLTRVSSSSLAFAQPAMSWIEEQTPSGTGTITFSSLGAFTHLEIMWTARGTDGASSVNMNLTLNGDTGANYDRESLSAAGTGVSSGEVLGGTSAVTATVTSAGGTANMASSGFIQLHDYRGTTFQKNIIAQTNLHRTTASNNTLVQSFSIGWRNTAAITSITLALAAGNYVAGSKFTLYGLR